MHRITKDNISQILIEGENDTIEMKRTIPAQLDIVERLISAFANTKGGSIIFGYDEQNREVVGVSYTQVQKLVSRIEKSKYNTKCDLYTIDVDDKVVAVLDVERSKTDLYVKGVAYIRSGDKTFSKVGSIRSKYLKDFIEEIQYRNRNPRDIKILELLDDLPTNPERILNLNTKLYRCRLIHDMKKAGKEAGFYGYGKDDSFVPPAEVTRDLRANYRYIPYLYCANHPYTALVEVRPRLGANVSIATINVNEKLTLLDFTLKTIPQRMTPAKLNLFSDLSMLFSKPVASDDDILDYIPTQYIAEYAKHLGYDGIVFRSSLTPELESQDINEHEELDRYNVVIFNYNKCSAVGSNIVKITRNFLDCTQIDHAPNQLDIHMPFLDMYY